MKMFAKITHYGIIGVAIEKDAAQEISPANVMIKNLVVKIMFD
jgi:hypothetical protein